MDLEPELLLGRRPAHTGGFKRSGNRAYAERGNGAKSDRP